MLYVPMLYRTQGWWGGSGKKKQRKKAQNRGIKNGGNSYGWGAFPPKKASHEGPMRMDSCLIQLLGNIELERGHHQNRVISGTRSHHVSLFGTSMKIFRLGNFKIYKYLIEKSMLEVDQTRID